MNYCPVLRMTWLSLIRNRLIPIFKRMYGNDMTKARQILLHLNIINDETNSKDLEEYDC